MKKSLWLLLVVAALIAVFAVAGCLQGTTPEEPTEPEEPTTPTPTDYCPTTTTTTWQKLYNNNGYYFQLKIKFDQPVFIQDLACYENVNNWGVEVSRYVPYKWYDSVLTLWKSAVYEAEIDATVTDVKFDGEDTFTLTFTIIDNGDSYLTVDGYDGLICSEADYNSFIELATREDGVAATDGSKYADVISWAFTGTASCGVVYDAQGNPCVDLCELSGSLCCEVTYCEECEEVPNCPIGEGTCL
ncbi:hypothetical protein [Atrimonas thermophila]|uniref:hypothetical protein n=1 Tax=Atrimonas thermophila TaxID=3064161 RepID=UPI00399CF7BF